VISLFEKTQKSLKILDEKGRDANINEFNSPQPLPFFLIGKWLILNKETIYET